MKYTSCPRCYAEFYQPVEECYSCGLVFSERNDGNKDHTLASKESEDEPELVLGGRSVEAGASSLRVGTTIAERYSILATVRADKRWVFYEALDRDSNSEVLFECSTAVHPLAVFTVQKAHDLGGNEVFKRVLASALKPFPYMVTPKQESVSFLDLSFLFLDLGFLFLDFRGLCSLLLEDS